MKKLTIFALSMTLVLAGAHGAIAAGKTYEKEVINTSNYETVKAYKSINDEEKTILVKAYDELDAL